MKKKFYKILSIIITVAILLTSLPIGAFAFFDSNEDNESNSAIGKIFELVDKRTATTKLFRLQDGTYYLAQYDTDVHYLDDDGVWQDIDNTLFANANQVSTNDARIKFAKKTNGSQELFSIHNGNRKLSLSLSGANKKVEAQISNNDAQAQDGVSELEKMTTLYNLSASVRYDEILKGTDIEYIINGSNIKENIIVKERAETYSYEFILSLNNLSASQDLGEIIITDPSTNDCLYKIPAAVMWDSAGAYSEAADISLDPLGNGKYSLTVTADAEWMNSPERVFPITVDPPLYTDEDSAVLDMNVSRSNGTWSDETSDTILLDESHFAYWKLTTLPALPASAFITNATISLEFVENGEVDRYIGAYDVLSDWDNTLCWNKINSDSIPEGNYSGAYVDYQHVKTAINSLTLEHYFSNPRYSFNITHLVKKWYSGSNYGVMFSMISTAGVGGEARFYSNDFAHGTRRPRLSVTYKDMKGLEDYWSYSSQSAGFAGNVSVNNASGNLILTIPTLTTTDALMPFTPTLVYDSAMAGRDHEYANARNAYFDSYTPKGMKLNIGETLLWFDYITLNGEREEGMYVWSDGDGTEHYFMPTSEANKYEDEDGLLLTLESSEDYETCTITDSAKNVRTFNRIDESYAGWYLKSISDVNGNKVSFDFDSNKRPTAVNLIPAGSSSITQLKIAYNSVGKIYAIWNPSSGEAVILRYSDSATGSVSSASGGYLRQMVRAHGATSEANWLAFYNTNANSNSGSINVDAVASYEYNTSGRITRVYNELSKYQLNYLYRNSKVIAVQESVIDDTLVSGQMIILTYGSSSTVVRTSGADDTINTDDDIITTYGFDSEGRTVSCYSTDTGKTQLYGASNGEYVGESNEKAKNNLKSSVATEQHSSNYIYNGGFEKQYAAWSTEGGVQFGATGIAHTGANSLTLKVNSTYTYAQVSQTVFLDEGEYYLSLYLDTYMVKSGRLYLKAESTNRAYSVVTEIPTNNVQAAPSFVPFGMKITADPTVSGGTERFVISLVFERDGSDTVEQMVWVDDIMLSRTSGAAEFDLLTFGHFEQNNEIYMISDSWEWLYGGSVSTADSGIDAFGNVLKINGGISEQYNAVAQTVTFASGSEIPSSFKLSGWAKGTVANSSPMLSFKLKATLNYRTSTGTIDSEYYDVKFDKGITDWQFASGVIEVSADKGTLISVVVEAAYHNGSGTGYFDNISLVANSELGSVYGYNTSGFAEYVLKGTQRTWYKYDADADHNNPVKVISSSKSYVKYEYDYLGRLTVEQHGRYTGVYVPGTDSYAAVGGGIAGEHIVYSTMYTYDEYGQVTESFTSGAGDTLTSSTSYITTTGSHIFGVTESETNSLGKTTRYFYDHNNGRLLAVIYPEGNGVCYTYDGMGNLVFVQSAGVTETGYEADSYSAWVIYRYNAATKRLDDIITTSTTYSFTYDAFGNTTEISAGNHELASYEYNENNGKLSILTYGNANKAVGE